MMTFLHRARSQGEYLGTVDQLDEILEEDKDTKGGNKEN